MLRIHKEDPFFVSMVNQSSIPSKHANLQAYTVFTSAIHEATTCHSPYLRHEP